MFARWLGRMKAVRQTVPAMQVPRGSRSGFRCGARGRNRTGTPLLRKATDFKSVVSTCFTTRAHLCCQTILLLLRSITPNRTRFRCLSKQTGNGTKKPPQGWLLRFWRREPESNRPTRICNPVHNRFAIAPATYVTGCSNKTGKPLFC